jgi:hypothetical protein
MGDLSDNFSLDEMTRSQTALRKGIDNTAPDAVVGSLKATCATLLEPARTLWGVSVHVDSGYRSPALNESVGGSATSAHCWGGAADLIPQGLDLQQAFDMIRQSDIPYDQVIFECKAWIHLGMAKDGSEPRKMALTATGGPGAWHYQRV